MGRGNLQTLPYPKIAQKDASWVFADLTGLEGWLDLRKCKFEKRTDFQYFIKRPLFFDSEILSQTGHLGPAEVSICELLHFFYFATSDNQRVTTATNDVIFENLPYVLIYHSDLRRKFKNLPNY